VNAELEAYRQQFEQNTALAQELTSGLTEAQFNWRPSSSAWSIQECLSHLTMVGHVETKALEEAVAQARGRGLTGAGPFEYPAWEHYILREIEPPVRHAISAPKRFVPVPGQPITGIFPTFLHVQSRFVAQIERADGLDLCRVKVPTPFIRLFKVTLGMTLAQAAAHQRRHLEQARRVREKLG
jgi:hypothetical protein